MKRQGITVYALACMLALQSPQQAKAQNTTNHRIGSNDTMTVSLSLCSNNVDIYVDGDDDTDLDFVIRDDDGDVVHTDNDSTDMTMATLRPNVSNGRCVRYPLRVVNHGDVYNDFTVRLTNNGGGAAADRHDRRIAVHNHTDLTLWELYGSNTGRTDWESDILGGDVISANTHKTVDMDDGTSACRFDFKFVMRNSRTQERSNVFRNNVDVCSDSRITVGPYRND